MEHWPLRVCLRLPRMTIPLIPLKITRTPGRGGEAKQRCQSEIPIVISNNGNGWIPPGQLSRTEEQWRRGHVLQRVDDDPEDGYYPHLSPSLCRYDAVAQFHQAVMCPNCNLWRAMQCQ